MKGSGFVANARIVVMSCPDEEFRAKATSLVRLCHALKDVVNKVFL